MLVGLSFPQSYSDTAKKPLTDSVAQFLGKNTKILSPNTREELAGVLRSYRPSRRTTTLLTNTHYNIEVDAEDSLWRLADHQFSTKGGVIYGAEPARDVNTYAYRIPADLTHITDNALYAAGRTIDSISGYFGRTYTDPHTILTDIKPTYTKPTKHMLSLFGSLHKTWWPGVGFFSPHPVYIHAEMYTRLAEQYPYASIIATKKDTSMLLTYLGIRHTYAELSRFKTEKAYIEYANTIRELSREDLLAVV